MWRHTISHLSLPYRKSFVWFNILPLASDFTLHLLPPVAENFEKFQRNSDIHNLNTRYKYDLHTTNSDLTKH
jgi:hypothetical protein